MEQKRQRGGRKERKRRKDIQNFKFCIYALSFPYHQDKKTYFYFIILSLENFLELNAM